MALTTEDVRAPETTGPSLPLPAPRPPVESRRAMFSWVAVIAALVASGLFVRSALSSDDADRRPVIVERFDTKDHPRYRPTAVVERADTKDHPRYNRSEVVLTMVVPDVKDHPLYGR